MHIVEQIAVQLGLEAKQYNSEADKVIKKTDDLDKKAGGLEGTFKGVSGALTKFAGVISALAVGSGLAKLISDIQKVNNELYFLEKNLGMSAKTIQAWKGAAEAGGGSAEGMVSSMKGLNKSMNDFVIRGDTTLLPFMNALGVSMVDGKGKLKDTDAMMLDLADSFSKMDREQAFAIGSDMGFDEGTLNTLLQGRDALKESLDYQKQMYVSSEQELAVSRELAKNQAQLNAHWQSMKLMIGNAIVPLLVKLTNIAKVFFEFLQRHQQTVKNVFEAMGIIIGAVLIPVLGKALIALLAFIAPFAPFIIVVGALSAAFIALYDDYKTWAEGGNSLFNWGAFSEYIDKATLSTDNLKNAFKNLGKELLDSTMPTLAGYANIMKMLLSGDFKGAGKLAGEMLQQYSKNVLGFVDDLTGQKKGTLYAAAGNLFNTANAIGAPSANNTPGSGSGYSGGSNPLLELLNKGETGGKSGSAAYSTPFSGMRIKAPKPLPEMTIGEIKAWQKANINEQKSRGIPADRRSSAAGRYQIIYTSMGGYQKGAGLTDNDLFSQENQDKMAMAMMQNGRFGLNAVKAGKATPSQFLDNILAPQWASVQNSRGQGQHNAKGFNHASITPAQSYKAIQEYLNGTNGAAAAQDSMNQSAPRISSPSEAFKNMRSSRVDVKIGDINVNTTASTVTGTTTDAMTAATNQINQLVGSMV